MRILVGIFSLHFYDFRLYHKSGVFTTGVKSWYVTDEAYLYTLMLYIEQNPLKAKIVKRLEEYPHSSYNYFLAKNIPECLKDAWIVKNHKNDIEAIKEMLSSKVDYSALQELKLASSLVEAPNIDKKPNIKKLENMFKNIEDTTKRNRKIVQVYDKGYSQHMIAKVLGLNQATVQRIIKRRKDSISIT